MKSGELTGQGTLFMRSGIYQQRTAAGELQLIFPLLETRGQGKHRITAIWAGTAAESFYHQQGAHIKAGSAIAFTFARLFCHNSELHAIVSTASVAPDRWDATVLPTAPVSSTPPNKFLTHPQPEESTQ